MEGPTLIRRLVALLVATAVFFAGAPYRAEADVVDLGLVQVALNGDFVGRSVPALLINDRIMVPLRSAEMMNFKVSWDATNHIALIQQVYGEFANDWLAVKGNERRIVYNHDGKVDTIDLDAPCVELDGRILIPSRLLFGVWEIPAESIEHYSNEGNHVINLVVSNAQAKKMREWLARPSQPGIYFEAPDELVQVWQ